MAAKWDQKAVNKVCGRSLLPVGGLCETLQVFLFSLDVRAPCFVLFFCSSVLRLLGLSSGNSSSLQQSGHLFTLNHSWLSILVCLLKHTSAFLFFSHRALISLNRPHGDVPRNEKAAWSQWGLRRILSLKLSKYTVNTLSSLLGYDWEDHTERLMGRRLHFKHKGMPIRKEWGWKKIQI